MRTDEIHYARSGEYHIAYMVEGDGSGGVDVLRVGAYAYSLALRRPKPLLKMSERYASLGRAISFDGRGMGLSDRLRDRRLPPIEERMDDLRAVLDDAGARRVLLSAGSDGGPLSCLFAATYPERTLGLVLMNTAPRIAWAPDYPWGLRREEFEREVDRMQAGWGTRAYAEEHAPWPMDGMTREETVDWWLEWMQLSAAPGDAVALWRMFYDSDVRNVLGAIRVPTLVLSRGAAMEEEAKAFAALIPGARQETMPGTAPTVMQERPDVYMDAIERFARALRDEEAELDSVLATVLFTDIVGSTARQAELGDRRWADLVREHHAVVRGCLARYRGRELDTAGDGFFAAFDGPARGIRCAQAIVTEVSRLGIEVRAGLHTGECRTVDEKIGGLAVSIGARVSSLAGPSEVLVSQTVRDLVAGAGLELAERGEHDLKGVPGAWRVYAVV
ncbi:MAG TPA: adenylate/guanylate cyclase domain-containing protein [Gaiella sp.]|uniref:adenylate/guanylate cyclase domain-containing protein n=1 Tax=Gaiella sp. TaxID=2663207 RepID=UPI002D801DE2|nr:adenylate/guanylate cyclase domain-containing protein [Gaiella sp.]HET9288691.1 adenylate/guanylate cyclase domain-containing protein [Gaiella sp.]